jgi:carboxypeptidase family protein
VLRHLVCVLGLFLFARASAWAVPVRVEAIPDSPGAAMPAQATVRAVAQQAAPGNGLPSAVTAVVRLPGETVLDLPTGVVWRIEGEAEGLWSEPRWLAPGPGNPSPSIQMRFFRSGMLQGFLDSAREASAVEVRFSSAPGASPHLARTVVDCLVAERRFRCNLPAGRFDLRLRAQDAIPVYRWGMDVQPGEVNDLGTLRLRRGASVVGWVQTEAAKAPDGTCRIRLAPRSYGPGNDPALQALSRETVANERGFFQLEDIPPGVYEVSAEQAGFAPARLQPVEVLADLETEIRVPLVLAPPIVVRLELDPPRDPSGSAWTVRLQKLEGSAELPGELYQGPVSAEGTWERKGVAPGRYRLLVVGPMDARWANEILEIGPGQSPIPISIPVLRVRGRVFLGDEPLAGATLWFGGRFGQRNVRFESDDHGEFEGALPEEGTWKVDLVSERESLRLPLPPVEVRKLPGAAFARVEIVLPDTRLHGEVVDEEGRPVPEAAVEVMVPMKTSRTRADKDGKFELRGLSTGPVAVEAESGKRTSGWIEAQVEEGKDSTPLRLVVREMMVVQGQVVSTRGPVPGARIQAWPSLDQTGNATIQQAVSGPHGELSLTLPTGTRSLEVFVAAPGHALRMFRAPCDPQRPFDITLEPIGGTLVLELGEPPAPEGILVHGGTFAMTPHLEFWAGVQGGKREGSRLVLPGMEVGDYWYCRGPEAVQAARFGQPLPQASCSHGSLSPLQELTLEAPRPASPPAIQPPGA